LGVSPRLTMLISGESLLNDGTALVIFTLMLKVTLGAKLTTGGVIIFLGSMSITSVLLGGFIGMISVLAIGLCGRDCYRSDAMIQVVVTICCGYMAFFLAESEFSTSGVLTTVWAGLVFAVFAWPRVVSREVMLIVWGAIEFICNTVIFFLAGLLFASTCYSRRHYIGLADWGWLLILYVVMMCGRAVMVAVLWWPLNKLGSPLQPRDGYVMVWSGLRGAVSLALAIIVDLEPEIAERTGSRVMFHAGGLAALTTIINATTVSALLRYLGMTKTPKMKQWILSQFEAHLKEFTHQKFAEHLQDPDDVRFSGASEGIVTAMVPSLCGGHDSKIPDFEDGGTQNPMESQGDLIRIYREVYLRVVQNNYWEAIADGVLPRSSMITRVLLQSANAALDNTWLCLNDWEIIEQSLYSEILTAEPSWRTKLSEHWLSKIAPLFRETYSKEAAIVNICLAALSFQDAHHRAQREVPKYIGSGERFDDEVEAQIARESSEQCELAEKMLGMLPKEQVEVAKSKMLARKLLSQQLERISFMSEKGLLTESEASHMEQNVNEAIRKLVQSDSGRWLGLATRVRASLFG